MRAKDLTPIVSQILTWPELEVQHVLQAHPGNCICIEFSRFEELSLLLNADLLNPSLRCGRYFATGSADALVSVWDANELACIKTFARLEWPVERNSIEK